MKTIKLLLYKLLGLPKYLQLVSRIYITLISWNFGRTKYPEIHYLKTIVKKGFHCIDIGSNLGYFSFFMSKYAGETGKVYAVEPIPLFGDIWKKNVARTKISNTELLPFALGSEEKMVQMGMPSINNGVHHGMTKIIDSEGNTYEKTFDVPMQIPNKLFQNLEKIDFIKIDVEGYESNVFANMKDILNKYHPIIQAELGGEENRKYCVNLLADCNYKPYILQKGNLIEITIEETTRFKQDLYFM